MPRCGARRREARRAGAAGRLHAVDRPRPENQPAGLLQEDPGDREQLRLRGEIKTEREAVKFEVVDPPTTPQSPVAPNRPLLLTGVLIVGLGIGAGAAFALGHLRSTFSTTAKLERVTGLPVLGAISESVTDAARAAHSARRCRR